MKYELSKSELTRELRDYLVSFQTSRGRSCACSNKMASASATPSSRNVLLTEGEFWLYQKFNKQTIGRFIQLMISTHDA